MFISSLFKYANKIYNSDRRPQWALCCGDARFTDFGAGFILYQMKSFIWNSVLDLICEFRKFEVLKTLSIL